MKSAIKAFTRNGHRTKPNLDTDRIGLLQTGNSTNSVTAARMASLPVTQGFSHLPLPRGPHQVDGLSSSIVG